MRSADHIQMYYFKLFLTYVRINYKIKFLEAQVLKSYRIFIQKSYRGWAFSLPPPPPFLYPK